MLNLGGQTSSGKSNQEEGHPAYKLSHDSGSNAALMAISEDCREPKCVTDGCLSNKGDMVVPNTPNPVRENGSSIPDSYSSSFRSSVRLSYSVCIEPWRSVDASDESPHTPEGCMFDPFAPGSDDMVLAPIRKHFKKDLRNIIARRLDFTDSPESLTGGREFDNEDDVEEMLLESIYEAFLEATLLNQTELFLAEHNADTPETPLLCPLLTGVANSCPAAPMKLNPDRRVSRAVINGLCRKLEF